MNNKIYNKTALILITLLGLMVLFIFAYSSCETETYADSTYNIYYVLDGGTNSPSNPTSVSSSSSSITLQPATKSGYKFLGWYKDSSYSKYIEKIKPSTMSGDMTLYALFTPYISLPVKYLYTDYYSAIDDVKGYINCYYSYSAYYYENVTSVASMVSGHSSYTIYSTSNTALSLGLDEGEYYSSASAGTPSYIRIASDTFYSINYELNGGAFKSGDLAYNYYYTRANITSHELTPIKDDAVFMGWYLDSSFTTTYYSSSFTPSNITLYAKWSAIHTINALYITTDFFAINEEVVRTIEYYDDDSDYIYSSNFAELFNLHTDYQFTIYNTSGNAISYFINEGVYASSKAYGTPSYIRYNTPQIYTIQYVLGDGGSVQEGKPLYSYYTKRADLTGNTNTPIKEGFRFLEWYLDSEYTQTMYSSSFTPSNITLYAKWGEISSVEAKITTTDFYIKTTQTILSVEYFDDTYDYIYDDSFANLFNYYTEYSFNIYTADNNIIPYYFNEGVYASSKANGVPAYIKYEAPEIYTISYVIGEDAIIPDGRQLYNYYTKRADLKDNTVEPIKENYIFSGWYLDSEHTSTIYTSSFTPSNITLYADWAELLYAPVMFYDALGDMELVNLGATYYYLSLDNDYVLGDYSDNTRQLPYYFDITGSDSYKVFSKSGNELSVYISEGYLLTKADEEIDYIIDNFCKVVKKYVD